MALMLLSILAWPARAYGNCPILKPEGLRDLLGKNESVRLVFFSSWCGSCREHLTAIRQDEKQTYFIGTFDSQERVTQAVQTLRKSLVRCYWDQEHKVAKFLGISEVPVELSLTQADLKARRTTP